MKTYEELYENIKKETGELERHEIELDSKSNIPKQVQHYLPHASSMLGLKQKDGNNWKQHVYGKTDKNKPIGHVLHIKDENGDKKSFLIHYSRG